MSTVKISNLPKIEIYDNGSVIPIVDSGSTQTSKIEIIDLMRAKGQSIIGSTGLILTSGINANDAQITSGDRHTIISARGATISDSENSFIASTYPGGGSSIPRIIGNGNTNSLMSVYNNVEINNSYMSSIIADENSKMNNGYTSLIAGSNNILFGQYVGGGYQQVALGSSNGSVDASTQIAVIASRDFSAHLQGSNTASMIASKNPTIEPVSNAAEVMTIINSKSSTLRPNQHNSMILNSDSVQIDDNNGSQTQISSIINGWGGGINGAGIGGNYQKMLINTYGTQITHGGSRVMAINANGGTISAQGDHNMLINSENKDIVGSRNKATVIGVWNNNDTEDYEDTVYVGALHNYGARSGKVIQGGSVSGTVDVDGNLGEMFEFTMVGNVEPNFINLREGQKFLFAIYNTTFNVTGATINGVGGNVLAKGGTISPTNNSWSYYTGWYDGTRVFLIEENGLSAI